VFGSAVWYGRVEYIVHNKNPSTVWIQSNTYNGGDYAILVIADTATVYQNAVYGDSGSGSGM